MSELADHPRTSLAAVVLVIGVTLAAFLPSLAGDWTGWDDTAYVVNNPAMHGLDGLRNIWTSRTGEQYYPLTFTLYWGVHAMFGGEPWPYHALSVLLHAFNAALVLRLTRALGIGGGWSVFLALVFALHPTQVMSVAWIAELKNTLSGFFTLMAMLAWTRSRDERRPGRAWYWLGVAAFLGALLSKTAVLGIPAAWILLDRFWFRASWTSAMARAIVPSICGVALAGVTYLFEERFIGNQSSPVALDLLTRIQVSGRSFWWYAATMFWPVGLSPAYPMWGAGVERLALWMPLAGLGVGGLALLTLVRRLDARVVWGLTHFFVVLVPILGILPYGNLALTYVSDHFLYLAGLGMGIAVAVFIRPHVPVSLRPAGVVLGVLVILALATGTLWHTRHFRDGEAMWTRGVEIAPDSYVAHMALGESLRGAGKLSGAVLHLRRAVDLRPDLPDAFIFLAAAQRQIGSPASARESYERAIQADPKSLDALLGLGLLLHEQRDGRKALETLERARDALGDHPEPVSEESVRMALGEVYLGFARARDALDEFSLAQRLRPSNARAVLGVATCHRSLGDEARAIATLEEGLRQTPEDAPLHHMLALILITAKDESLRDADRAIEHAKQAAALTQRTNAQILATLARAHALAKQWRDASAIALEASGIAQEQGQHALASRLRDESIGYQSPANPR